MTQVSFAEEARAFACAAHAGQTDKLGHPYSAHLAHVAAGLRDLGPDHEALGWLHDIVEDCDVTLEHIRVCFGLIIAQGVDAMTRRKGEDYFKDYLPRVLAHPLAVHVKYADSRHNLGKCHLLPPGETRSRLERKYARVLAILEAAEPGLRPKGSAPDLLWSGEAWIEA